MTDYLSAIFDYCVNKANENKKWAIDKNKELNGREWSEASEVSKTILKEYTSNTIEDMAKDIYKYLQYRSHCFDRYNYPIDKPAFEIWAKLSGKEPKNKN